MKAYFYLGLLMLIFPREAFAYLDPGTGSYLVQILAAGILASLFFIKSWWRKLKTLLLKILGKDKKES